MSALQQVFISLYAMINLAVLVKGYYEIKKRKNPFGLASPFGFLGIFVWGDALVVSIFWIAMCAAAIFMNDWYFFLLICTVFWVVRSGGEIIYWINEQFAANHRNPPHTLLFYKLFGNDSIWFVYQLFWQCVLVISIILTIYTSFLWLSGKT